MKFWCQIDIEDIQAPVLEKTRRGVGLSDGVAITILHDILERQPMLAAILARSGNRSGLNAES